MSFELIPAIEADKRKNGYGRDAPNLYPVLPEPVGRFKFVTFSLKLFNLLNLIRGFLKSLGHVQGDYGP